MKKKIFLPALALAAFFATEAQAQFNVNIVNLSNMSKADTIDHIRLTVQYEADFLIDTLKTDKRHKETMMLEIGAQRSLFYSYTQYIADSVQIADAMNNVSIETMTENSKKYQGGELRERTFKNYPDGKTTTLEKIVSSDLRCEEPAEHPKWILTGDTTTVLSYPCRKAICTFRGREWTAWFTTEIPVSEGPWKLSGLPGLILKATDSRNHYIFTATGVEQNRTHKPLLFGGAKYQPLTRKQLAQMHKRFHADPIGFVLSTSPNTTVTVRDEHGNEIKGPKNTPYNPLELPL